MSRAFGEEGASNLKTIFWLLLLFAVVHIGIQIIPMYLDFWRMEDEMQAKVATVEASKPEDLELQYSLAKYAEGIGLPIKQENIVIFRNEEARQITVNTAWDVELRFFWGICGDPCVRKYHFQPSATGKL